MGVIRELIVTKGARSATRRRMPLMAVAGLSLLAALGSGLVRLGWPLPPVLTLAPSHGPLMVIGFLGTLIGLERAVAVKRPWAYGAPVCAGLGALGLLVGASAHVSHLLAIAASGFLLAIFAMLSLKRPEGFLAAMGVGAVLWGVGNVLWHWSAPLFQVAPWWVGFLVLTIAGERLELSRLLSLGGGGVAAFFAAIGVLCAGLLVGLGALDVGIRLAGIGLMGLALWLLRFDLARRTIRQGGLPRYMAACLLSGYLWLGVGGLLWLVGGDRFGAGPAYDAMLHSLFVGFVFSMIFAHAPIMFPSVTGVSLPFRPAFYSHWALLHLSLLLRVGGDLSAWAAASRWGGMLNALAIVLFLANTLRAVAAGRSGGSA